MSCDRLSHSVFHQLETTPYNLSTASDYHPRTWISSIISTTTSVSCQHCQLRPFSSIYLFLNFENVFPSSRKTHPLVFPPAPLCNFRNLTIDARISSQISFFTVALACHPFYYAHQCQIFITTTDIVHYQSPTCLVERLSLHSYLEIMAIIAFKT